MRIGVICTFLILAVLAGFHYLFDSPDLNDRNEGKQLPEREASVDGGVDGQIGSVAEERMVELFGAPSQASVHRLAPWHDDVFLAQHISSDSMIRSEFLAVDPEGLRIDLLNSLKYSQNSSAPESGVVRLHLFADQAYDIVVNSYQLGSTGFSNFHARMLGSTGSGPGYFEFQISPDGEISGTGITGARVYQFMSTPDLNVLVVAEIDMSVAGKIVTVN